MNFVVFLVFAIVLIVVAVQALWNLLPYILLAFAIHWIISTVNGRGRRSQGSTFSGENPYQGNTKEDTYTYRQESRNPNIIDVEFEEREVDDER